MGALPPDRHQLVVDCQKLVHWVLARHSPLRPGHRDYDDAAGDMFLVLVKCARVYDPGRGLAFTTFATASLKLHVRSILERLGRDHERRCVELDRPRGDGQTSLDVADPASLVDVADTIVDADVVERLLGHLKPRWAAVVRWRVLDGRTLDEVGAKLGGVSKERVRQIERKALEQLREVVDLWQRTGRFGVSVPTVETCDKCGKEKGDRRRTTSCRCPVSGVNGGPAPPAVVKAVTLPSEERRPLALPAPPTAAEEEKTTAPGALTGGLAALEAELDAACKVLDVVKSLPAAGARRVLRLLLDHLPEEER